MDSGNDQQEITRLKEENEVMELKAKKAETEKKAAQDASLKAKRDIEALESDMKDKLKTIENFEKQENDLKA